MAQDRQASQQYEDAPGPAQVDPIAQTGGGVAAISALLAKGGVPDPKAVVAILDAHRGERDAIFAFLQQQLGNAYVRQVVATADKLRLSIERKEVVAGDPSDPDGGYFLASAKEQGARWRTDEGGFTGKVDKEGLDSTVKLDEDDALHAKINKDKSGTLGWERDGKTQAELHGSYKSGDQWEAGLRRDWALDSGTLTTGIRHQQTKDGARDEATAAYKSTDGATTADASAGVMNGEMIGSLAASHKLDDTTTIAGSLAHDTKGTTLAGSYKDAATTVDGKVARSDDGVFTGSLAGSHKLDDETTVNGSLTRSKDATSLAAGYKDATTSLDGKLARSDEGDLTGSLAGSHKLDDKTTIDGSITRSKDATSLAAGYKDATTSVNGTLTRPDEGRLTGSLAATHQLDPRTSLSGSYVRSKEADAFELGASHKPNDRLSLDGKLRHEELVAGGSQTTATFSERYKSGSMIQGLDLSAGTGVRDHFTTTGSLEAQLAPNLYAGAWGRYHLERGKPAEASLGGSLTWTMNDKQALTLAGVVDDSGMLETRLQFDLFKSKINSVSALSQHKKDALVSLFISYQSQVGDRRLDDRFGAPQMQHGSSSGQVMGGIRINF